jgi:hypothetical protein
MLSASLTAELLGRSESSIHTIVSSGRTHVSEFVWTHLSEVVGLGLCAVGSVGWSMIIPLLTFLATGDPTPTPTPPIPF